MDAIYNVSDAMTEAHESKLQKESPGYLRVKVEVCNMVISIFDTRIPRPANRFDDRGVSVCGRGAVASGLHAWGVHGRHFSDAWRGLAGELRQQTWRLRVGDRAQNLFRFWIFGGVCQIEKKVLKKMSM